MFRLSCTLYRSAICRCIRALLPASLHTALPCARLRGYAFTPVAATTFTARLPLFFCLRFHAWVAAIAHSFTAIAALLPTPLVVYRFCASRRTTFSASSPRRACACAFTSLPSSLAAASRRLHRVYTCLARVYYHAPCYPTCLLRLLFWIAASFCLYLITRLLQHARLGSVAPAAHLPFLLPRCARGLYVTPFAARRIAQALHTPPAVHLSPSRVRHHRSCLAYKLRLRAPAPSRFLESCADAGSPAFTHAPAYLLAHSGFHRHLRLWSCSFCYQRVAHLAWRCYTRRSLWIMFDTLLYYTAVRAVCSATPSRLGFLGYA